ncbi:MAG: replication-associated recombination protein A [Oscillospiraceae bacterium]|nr:replication-associated recombination protein A [Oscillospiraceae bacterium]
MEPLASRYRPFTLEQIVGQEHIIGSGKILNRIINSGHMINMIFYGPPGTGKTSLANIIAKSMNMNFYKLNGTIDATKDIKEVLDDSSTLLGYKGILLYIDEIHHFNKKTQQLLLEYIENGKVNLIGSTTENPYFYIFSALLSRCTVIEFKEVSSKDILILLKNTIKRYEEDHHVKITYDENALIDISEYSSGDARRGVNILESIIEIYFAYEKDIHIDVECLKDILQDKVMKYDRDGDAHYDILSAFQKSIRGSDENAALHYLSRLIKSQDLISICRRLMVTACEDIGLAYPNSIPIVKSCIDSAVQLGFPEARIPLSDAVILLSKLPKSNSGVCAIDEAMNDINTRDIGDVPMHLKDGHYSGATKMGRALDYKYPHGYPNNFVKQQYLPNKLMNRQYYKYGDNKFEKSLKDYWDKIKKD